MIIVDGSDLTNYRIYSNKVFRLARAVLGDQVPVEKLGMDELFMDVSHLVDAHLSSLEHGEDKAEDGRRWFALKDEEGFWYDSQSVAGHAYPGPTSDQTPSSSLTVPLDNIKMQLASHIALHVRSLILTRVGLTSSAGISPSKPC
jgi:DNA polymerase iota